MTFETAHPPFQISAFKILNELKIDDINPNSPDLRRNYFNEFAKEWAKKNQELQKSPNTPDSNTLPPVYQALNNMIVKYAGTAEALSVLYEVIIKNNDIEQIADFLRNPNADRWLRELAVIAVNFDIGALEAQANTKYINGDLMGSASIEQRVDQFSKIKKCLLERVKPSEDKPPTV